MTQNTLFDTTPSPHRAPDKPEPKASRSIEARFADFHAKHPEVYKAIVWWARRRKGAGYDHWSMKSIWERLRDTGYAATEDVPGIGSVKLNNDYTAFYAKLVMEQEADLAGFFEVRK